MKEHHTNEHKLKIYFFIYSEFRIKLFIMLSVECDSLALSMLGEKKRKKERKKKRRKKSFSD